MNTTKLLLATLVGAIVSFLIGWVVYGMLLMPMFMENMTPESKALMIPEADQNIAFYFLSSLCFAFMLAYIYERWAGIRTWSTGATVGAVISLLFTLGMNLQFMASMKFYTSNSVVVYDIIGSAITGALTGAAVGWMLGYNRN
jgi:hypothetical protein